MLDLKKIFKYLKFGVLKPKIFIILFVLFFSTLAIAATLSVTWKGALIPGGNAQSGLSCTATTNGVALDLDRTQDPYDVVLSNDGLQVFTVNLSNDANIDSNQLSMNRLGTPNEILTEKIRNGSNPTCADLEGANPGVISGGEITTAVVGLHIGNGGRTFFVLDTNGDIGKFNLSTPYDISTMSYETKVDFGVTIDSMHFSRDGKKLFTLSSSTDDPVVTTYSLPAPFDISSTTQIHQVDLDTKGIDVSASSHDQGFDIEFNPDGSAMFILMANTNTANNNFVYQFSLGKNYDVSTAVNVGKWDMNDVFLNRDSDELDGRPRGMGFSSDGMKLFVVEIMAGNGVDQINQFDLECPYGLVQCTSDSASNLGSQVQLAKQNIGLNTSIIFKRFEWVKRNRNNKNLNNLTASIKLDNPLLNYWIKKLPTKIVSVNGAVENGRFITIGREYKKRNKNSNNLDNFTTAIKSDNQLLNSWTNKLPEKITARRASLKEKSSKDKKSNWSYWSHGDISIGNYEGTILEKPKQIKTTGLTFGADKIYGDNKLAGLAIRYGGNGADIRSSAQQTDMESLTLNIYGIIPRDENQYINAVLGLSVLRFDQKYLGQLTGERNGKQAFAAVNYRTKKSYGDLNLTPSGRFTYAVTQLSDFTNFISTVKPATDVIYEEDTFESGEVAAGFLFNLNDIETSDGIFKPNGGLEIVYDITPDVKLEYSNQGSSNVNTATIEQYSHKNIRGNIGIEAIYNNGLTLSLNYERFQHIDSHRYSHTDIFLIKVGHITEEDSEFAFNFDPLKNNETSIDYTKNINGFDVKVSSNYSLMNQIPDYGANLEVSSKF